MNQATPANTNLALQRKKRGFTLTEIAIVLGIIGLILGAIWVAAASVYNNLRISKATTELLSVTQAIRSLYATSTTVDNASGTDESASLVSAGVFPSDAVSGATANGPWGGSTIKVFSSQSNGGTAGDSFQVAFINVPKSACITLATSSTGSAADKGLISTDAVTTAGVYQAPSYTYSQANAMSVANAAAKCTGTNDDVAFTFKLKN